MRQIAVVIPAFNEFEWICHTISSLEEAALLLDHDQVKPHVTVVVNQPVDHLDRENNLKTISFLKNHVPRMPISILDCSQPGLKQGVGEARHLGALHAISNFNMKETDVLMSLDADSMVDRSYFLKLSEKDFSDIAAFTLGFEHDISKHEQQQEICLYESYLRYMKWNLTASGSDFDFYTIGSCLGTTVKNYLVSGGFMKRPATEDYHFLNKMRKLGDVPYWPDIKVFPSSRKSDRVFLGTGHFLSHFKANHAHFPMFFPKERSFLELKEIIRLIRDMFEGESAFLQHVESSSVLNSFFTEHKILFRLRSLAQNSSSKQSFLKKIPLVFDGLQTLRLLKCIQGTEEEVTVEEARKQMSRFFGLDSALDPVSSLLEFRRKDLDWSRSNPFSSF